MGTFGFIAMQSDHLRQTSIFLCLLVFCWPASIGSLSLIDTTFVVKVLRLEPYCYQMSRLMVPGGIDHR